MNEARVCAASEGIETPVAAVDEAAMERNLAAMATTAAGAGLRLRPHAKTHKSAYVAQRQLAHGAAGLTVATLTEAEVFADAGAGDLLLAVAPVGAAKLRRLEALVDRGGRLAVSLDDLGIARALPPAVDVLWEVDSGHHRVGTAPGEATTEAVSALLDVIAPERFRGLMTFPGQVYGASDEEGVRSAADQERDALTISAQLIRERGIVVRELSVGSSPTARFDRSIRIATEMRPGSYVYGDAQQVVLGSRRLEDCALGVVATVISTPERNRAVIDAGSKALSADVSTPQLKGFGFIAGREDLVLERLSEEHGMIVASGDTGLRAGDCLVVIPAHCCTTVNLHPAILMVGDRTARWDPVAARGWRRELN